MIARSVLSLVILLGFLRTRATAQDHLEPETGLFAAPEWQFAYARNLREILLKDAPPDHDARMICRHSFSPEWVVTVTRDGEREPFSEGTHDYSVEYVGANKILFNDEGKTVRAGVRRERAPLDRPTAEAVSEVWRRMLLGVRRSEGRDRADDGVRFHFSRASGGFRKAGDGPPAGGGDGQTWTSREEEPHDGMTGEMVSIGLALKSYTLAKPEGRGKIGAEIKAGAERLKAKSGPPSNKSVGAIGGRKACRGGWRRSVERCPVPVSVGVYQCGRGVARRSAASHTACTTRRPVGDRRLAIDYNRRTSRRRSFDEPGHAHELTFTCYHRYPFLKAERACTWLSGSIASARADLDFAVWAYVFLPDHVHLIVWPRRPTYSTAAILRAIKEPVGRRALNYLADHRPDWLPRLSRERRGRQERLFWQSGGGFDRNVTEAGALASMIDYIHDNPVRRGLVERSTDWPWSSAGWYAGNRPNDLEPERIPPEWGSA